jgi:hypothetical protein
LLGFLGVVKLGPPPKHHIGFECLIETFSLGGHALSVCSLETTRFLGVDLTDCLLEVIEVIVAVFSCDGAGKRVDLAVGCLRFLIHF